MTKTPAPEPAQPPTISLSSPDSFTILRRKRVELQTGYARSTIYNKIEAGLFPRPVSLGGRAVGWPASEIAAMNAARIAGRTDDEIRALVRNLELARRNCDGALAGPATTNQPLAPAHRHRRDHHGRDRRLQHDDGGAA